MSVRQPIALVGALLLASSSGAAQRGPAPPDSGLLRQAESQAGTDASRWTSVAAGWLARGDTAEAMAVLGRGLPVARGTRVMRLALAELHVRRQAPEPALDVLAPLPAGDASAVLLRAAAESQRALARLQRGDTTGALEALERAWAARRDEPTGIALAQLSRMARLPRGAALADSLAARPAASPAAFALAGEVAVAQGRLAKADSVLGRGTARHPRVSDLWMALGDVRKQRRAWREGAQAYTRAAALRADPTPAELALGRLYLASGDTTSARDTWRAMATTGRPAVAQHAAAERLARFGGSAAADSIYRRLVAADSGDGRAWSGLARLAERRGTLAVAVSQWRRADDTRAPGPWPAFALRRLTPATDVAGRRQAAARALWRGLAMLLEREQASGTGIAPLGTAGAPEDEPESEPALLQRALQALADTLATDDRWGAGELASAGRAFGEGRILRLAEARAASARGDTASALHRYASLVREAPADAPLRAEYGRALLAAGQPVAARETLALSLEQQPEDSDAFRTLVRAAQGPEDLESLAARIGRLRARRPGSPILAERELELWHRLGRPEAASRVASELAALKRQAAGGSTP